MIPVVFAGGGTGGHLYPAMAIADELRRMRPDVEAIFMGAERGIEARILPERGERHVLFPVRAIDRSRLRSAVGALWALKRATLAAAARFHELKPAAVVATGGFAAAPAGLAAATLGVPLLVQEQNAFPGLVLRWLSRWASEVHIAFPEASRRLPRRCGPRVRLSGNPVRAPVPDARRLVRRELGIPPETFLVVATGGSQGAAALNHAMLGWARAVRSGRTPAPEGTTVLWSYGERNRATVTPDPDSQGHLWLKAVPYIEDLPSTFVAAELAVGRAGAMTTAEICNAGLPSVLVPLPTAAADHQAKNARALADAGASVVLEEDRFTGRSLSSTIAALVKDRARLERMSLAAKGRARPDAAHRIASGVANLLAAGGEA